MGHAVLGWPMLFYHWLDDSSDRRETPALFVDRRLPRVPLGHRQRIHARSVPVAALGSPHT
jgi:hypothetical protein